MGHRHTLLVEVAYEGAAFHGVAPQPGFPTVSAALERHLTSVFNAKPHALTFAARTDRGVSALQNFATCWFRDITTTSDHLSNLSARLPGLHVRRGAWVSRQVNARNSTHEKHYRYLIRDGQTKRAVEAQGSKAAWLMAPSLDVGRMQRAAAALRGSHDFSAFRAAGCSGKDPIKTITNVDVRRADGEVVIDVVGRAFLRKMVRIMVGTLAEVGAGLRPPDAISTLLLAGTRHEAGLTAPAHGLCLVSVELCEAEPLRG